jgi:DNA-binding GntR family transcriptional regulator
VVTTRDADSAIVRRSSGEQAALYIRRLIFDGELRPGERVPQDQVAEALGMSRIPVREALIGLDREGWVRIEMHRGVFVSTLDEDTVRDHYDLLALAYSFAAKRAAAQWDDESDQALAALVAEFAATADAAEQQRLSIAFHAMVVSVARSPRLRAFLRAMPPLVPGEFFDVVPEALVRQGDWLHDIAAALRDRDGERAARHYVEMLGRNAGLVVEAFRSRGLFEPPGEPGRAGGTGGAGGAAGGE